MTALAFRSISKTYPGGIQAVCDLNLDVAAGEMLVLVGPSGCGKSTTLRMTAGLEEITSGTISLDGQVVNEVHPKDRNLAMVFQDYALYPHMTVAQNIAFGLKLRGYPLSEIEARVRSAAERLELTDLLERKPRTLSGGQRQRVALGRAMVRQPKAFLFDEPLSNLDPRLRGEMRSEIKRLQQTLRTTALFVTHDQEEAMTLGDRLAVLHQGRLQQCGEPLEVYEKPSNRFVAGFVGHPAMNFIPGHLQQEGDDLLFDEGTTRFILPKAMAQTLNTSNWASSSKSVSSSKSIVLGIRPEHIQLRPIESFVEGEPVLPIRIGLVEPLGDRMDVHTTSEQHKLLLARIPSQRGLKTGETWLLRFDLFRSHLFAASEEGNRIA